MLLFLDNDTAMFAFIAYVVDVQGGMSEDDLTIALDVLDDSYKNYLGSWNDGMPYFVSPRYFIGDGVEVTGEWIRERLKEFWDAYMFLQANLFLIGDITSMDIPGQNN